MVLPGGNKWQLLNAQILPLGSDILITGAVRPSVCVFHPKCVRERGRGMRRERGKKLASPTVSPIHKEKDGGGCIPENQVYPYRYSINSVVQLVRDIASREISDKEVQVCASQCFIVLNLLFSTVSAGW